MTSYLADIRYHMARNIGMELNLVVSEINHVLPNVTPPTFSYISIDYKGGY